VRVELDTGLVLADTVTAGDTPTGRRADGPTGRRADRPTGRPADRRRLLEGETDPVQALADSAYGSGATREALVGAGHELVIEPLP